MESSKELQDFHAGQGAATPYEALPRFLQAIVDLDLSRNIVDDVSRDGKRRVLIGTRTDRDAEIVNQLMTRRGWVLEHAIKLSPTPGGALYFVKE